MARKTTTGGVRGGTRPRYNIIDIDAGDGAVVCVIMKPRGEILYKSKPMEKDGEAHAALFDAVAGINGLPDE